MLQYMAKGILQVLLRLPNVLVCLGCHNRIPQRIESEIRVSAWSVSREKSVPGLQKATVSLCPCMVVRQKESGGEGRLGEDEEEALGISCYKGTKPITKAPHPHDLF